MKRFMMALVVVVLLASIFLTSCGEAEETTTAPPTTAPPSSTTPSTTPPPSTSVKPPPTTTAPPPATMEPVYGGTIRIITPLDPTVLGYPPQSSGRATFYQYCVNERLVVYAPDVWTTQNFEGVLATDWESKNDMRTYEFTLREGVKFHDGSPWNAEACKWNLDLRKAARTNVTFNDMLSCQVLDDYKVRINFSVPKAFFLAECATGVYFVSPTSYMAAGSTDEERKDWAMTHPVGTGPFKLKDVMTGSYVRYERFDDYWRGKPYLDGIEFLIIPDATVSGAMLEAGDADMYTYADFTTSIELEKKEGLYARYRDYHSPQLIVPQAQDPESFWYDTKARQALQYALNREAYAKAVDLGTGQIKVMYQLPFPGSPEYREGWGRKYDPEKAKELFAEAGLEAGFECSLHVNAAVPILQDIAVFVQSDLADMGIKANINIISPGQYMSYLNRGWPSGDLFMSGVPNEPISSYVAFRNYTYKDLDTTTKWDHDMATTPEMIRLYDELVSAVTPEDIEAASIALFHQAMDDAGQCFLIDWPDTAVMHDYVHTDWISYSTKVWNADQTWMEPH